MQIDSIQLEHAKGKINPEKTLLFHKVQKVFNYFSRVMLVSKTSQHISEAIHFLFKNVNFME